MYVPPSNPMSGNGVVCSVTMQFLVQLYATKQSVACYESLQRLRRQDMLPDITQQVGLGRSCAATCVPTAQTPVQTNGAFRERALEDIPDRERRA